MTTMAEALLKAGKIAQSDVSRLKKLQASVQPKPSEGHLKTITQKDFKEKVASKCESKQDWACSITTYACKDYLCPKLKSLVLCAQQ